jgi:hypothetical protein
MHSSRMADASHIMATTPAPAGQLAASYITQWDTICRTKRHMFKRLPCISSDLFDHPHPA